MKIESKVWLRNDVGNKQKANADVVFDGCFVVKGIRIMQGDNGLFVAMPSKKVGNDYKQDCFPITKEFKQELDSSILEAYEAKLSQVVTQEENQSMSMGMGM